MPRRKKEDEIPGEKPPPRGAANARERTRMRVLSRAFGRLKLTLPWVPPDTKLSKLDTLRLATSYISHLKNVLTDDSSDSVRISTQRDSKISLRCWPYHHHHPVQRLHHSEEAEEPSSSPSLTFNDPPILGDPPVYSNAFYDQSDYYEAQEYEKGFKTSEDGLLSMGFDSSYNNHLRYTQGD